MATRGRGEAPRLPPAEGVTDLILGIIDRTAAYSWPPAAAMLATGHAPRLTRRGWHLYYLHRQEQRSKLPPLDLRAIEAELAYHTELFAGSDTGGDEAEGMTLADFAAWAGIDRRRITLHLVEIPPGERPQLTPGQIPVRVLGNTKRVFRADVLGEPIEVGGNDGTSHQEAASGSADPGRYHRQVTDLRRRYSPRG
ncbi:MAG: hypothetical protein V2A73_01275 [Pseudomonadota bacterium]